MKLEAVRIEVDRLLPQLRSMGVVELLVFGSVARGESGVESDIDFVVEFSEGSTIDDYFRVLFLLEDALDSKVDLVERDALKARIADRVLAEAIRVA